MSHILHFIFSFSIIVILSLLISTNPKNIRIRYIIQLLTIEIVLGYFILHSQIGLNIIQKFSSLFNELLNCASIGINFIFGGMQSEGLATFFLTVLCPIIFISALIGILQYTYILNILIQIIGTTLSKINGMGKLESFNAISSLILGQSENFIIYKDIIEYISKPRIYTMAITSMSTVSFSIVGAYMTILSPKCVVAALILNIFSTFVILSILNPYVIDKKQDLQIPNFHINDKNFFEIVGEYIEIGLKITTTICAMLIGFIALIAALNTIFEACFDISIQKILGYIFFPFAWIIGIPQHEITQASSIMATKLISNEFVAIINLKKISHTLSPHTVNILSIFLVSFSNFSSIGIITGSIKKLNKTQGIIVAKYGWKLIYSSTLVNILSATIANLVISPSIE